MPALRTVPGTKPSPANDPAPKRPSTKSTAWRTRIVGSGEAAPDQLLANPRNWRVHPRAQQRALAGALDEVGWVAQVLVNQRTGHVVDGHLRVELAISRGEPSVPVTYVDLSEEEERLVLATLDPLVAMAEADRSVLEELLRDLAVDDAGLRGLLDGLADQYKLAVHGGAGDPDALPPEPDDADVYVQPGDLWQLGEHRLLCGDATNPQDVARLLDGATPRLLATDPPYGVELDPTWRDRAGHNGLGPAEPPYMLRDGAMDHPAADDATAAPHGGHGRTRGHRNTSLSGDTRIDWSDAFALVPSLEVGYVWHAGVHAAAVAQGLVRVGFEIVEQVIWDKGLFAMSRSWYHWAHEPCWVVRKPGVPHLFIGERDQATVWRAPSPKMIMSGSTEEKIDHPTQKPVVLFETPIRNHLRAGEAVYEPFSGSGSCLIAAERLGRRCYAMELDPKYVQLAKERWERSTGREAVQVDG